MRWPPVIRAKVIRTHTHARTLIKPKKWNKIRHERASLSVCVCLLSTSGMKHAISSRPKAIVPWWLNIIHSVMPARARVCVCRCVFAFHFVHRAVFIFKWGKLSVRNINNYDCFIPLTINRERSFCVVIIAIAVVIVIIITSTATPQIFSLSHRFRSHIHNLFTDKCANRNACRWSKIITPHGKLVYLSSLKIWHE